MTSLLPTYAPATDRRLSERPRFGETVSQTLSMARRSLIKMRRTPEQFFDVTLAPIIFTLMFAYVFGGALGGSVKDYLPTLIPGILAQTTITASMATGVSLRDDMDKGVFNRFKSLPIARIAPLAGPAIADLVRYAIAATITLGMGVLIGYRPDGGFVGALGCWALAIVMGWSLSWIFTLMGALMKSAQGVQGVSSLILFPLTFLSNAFVDPKTMPDWLEAFVKVNPVSHVVTACRDLAGGHMTAEVGWALLACAALVAIFAPLSHWAFSKKM